MKEIKMKNYKNKIEKQLQKVLNHTDYGTLTCGDGCECYEKLLELFDSLPDQEPKECEHKWREEKFGFNHAVNFCPKCEMMETILKDLPKLPEKLDFYEKDGSYKRTGIEYALHETINSILDYLKK